MTEQCLEEFKKIYFEEFGLEISDDIALNLATNLLNLFSLIYKPVTTSWENEYAYGKNRQHNKYKQVQTESKF